MHHKVAARVICVFTEQDAQAAARAEAQQNPPTYGALGGQGPGMPGQSSAFGFGGANGAGASNGMPGAQRRSTMQPQGLVGMGGMGGGARPPGKGGLTFDHILSRLQGELQKSRETGAELHSLTNAMNDIHETLGGNIVRLSFCPSAKLSAHFLRCDACSPLPHHHTLKLFPQSSLHKLIDQPSHLLQPWRLDHRILLRRSASYNRSCTRRRCPWRTIWIRYERWNQCWLSTSLSSRRYRPCGI